MTRQVVCDGCGDLIKDHNRHELWLYGIPASSHHLHFHPNPTCIALWASREIKKEIAKDQAAYLNAASRLPWWRRILP